MYLPVSFTIAQGICLFLDTLTRAFGSKMPGSSSKQGDEASCETTKFSPACFFFEIKHLTCMSERGKTSMSSASLTRLISGFLLSGFVFRGYTEFLMIMVCESKSKIALRSFRKSTPRIMSCLKSLTTTKSWYILTFPIVTRIFTTSEASNE